MTLTGAARGADGVSLEAKPAALGLDAGRRRRSSTRTARSRSSSSRASRRCTGSSGVDRARRAREDRRSPPRVDGDASAPAPSQGTVAPPAPALRSSSSRSRRTARGSTTATTTTDGASRLAFARRRSHPGTYRVRCAPGRGLVAGRVGRAHGAVRRDRAPCSPLRRSSSRWRVAARASTTPSPCRRGSGTSTEDNAWTFWAAQPQLAPVKVAVIDSGIDGDAPRPEGRVVAAQVLRRRLAVHGRAGPRHVRRRRDRGEPVNSDRASPGLAFNAQLIDRQGRRRPTATVSLRGRGRRDPLGGRPGRAGDQPQPRRRARPARPGARHVLAARAGGGRVRVLEGRRRRRRRRERPAVAARRPGGSRTTRRRCRT